MVRRLLCIALSWLALVPLAQAASLEAKVDRRQLSMDQHLLLTLKLFNSDTRLRAEGVKPNVDLTLLSDAFDIGKPEVSNHYNIYQGQGRARSELRVELFPKHSGTLTIPPFEVDGQQSQAIRIAVREASGEAAAEVFARAGSNLETVWAGQQLVVYMDLYHRVVLDKAAMGDSPSSEPVDMDLLQHWKLPQASRVESIDGYDYEVERIAWAIFPERIGPLNITLPDIWVTTQAGRQQRLPFQTLEFEVKPLPTGLPRDIIIGKPEIQLVQALKPEIKTNQLSQWRISLRAPVPVTSLPRYLPGIRLDEELKLYMDAASYDTQRSNDGIIDHADYTLSVMPLSPGQFAIPAVRIPYFDPELGRASLVELPAQPVTVVGAPVPKPETAIDKNTITPDSTGSSAARPWQLASLALGLLWLATLLLWWRQGARTTTSITEDTAPALRPTSQHPAPLQQLLDALGSETLEAGLQKFLHHQPNNKKLPEAVRAVQAYYYGRSEMTESALQALVNQACEQIRNTAFEPPSKTADWRQAAFKPLP